MVELSDRADLLNAEIQAFPKIIAANPAIDALAPPRNRPPEKNRDNFYANIDANDDANALASMHCHYVLHIITSRQRKNEYWDCSIRRQRIIICEKTLNFHIV